MNILRRKDKQGGLALDATREECIDEEKGITKNLVQRVIIVTSPFLLSTSIIFVFVFCCFYSSLALSPQERALRDALSSQKEMIMSKYPNCKIHYSEMPSMGDGICNNNSEQNSFDCNFDDGDCIKFNEEYPACNAVDVESLGNGHCNSKNNVPECDFDGGDCCPVADSPFLGDGYCDGLIFNTEVCGFDAGDCSFLNSKFPNCDVAKDYTLLELYIKNREIEASPIIRKSLGDGVCENFELYNVPECGFEGGDCVECMHKFKDHFLNNVDGLFDSFGDSECNQVSPLNIDICGYDGGDCSL